MMTINISLPKHLYQDAQKILSRRGYSSMSELMRDALRHAVYPHLTENGFTPNFENLVLESAKEPIKRSRMWDGKTPFTKFVLGITTKKHGQGSLHRKVS